MRSHIIAISDEDYQLFGCPHCGSAAHRIEEPVEAQMEIGRCGKTNYIFIILLNGVKNSPQPIVFNGGEPVYPGIQMHPRRKQNENQIAVCPPP
jgi:hypothetical protein